MVNQGFQNVIKTFVADSVEFQANCKNLALLT